MAERGGQPGNNNATKGKPWAEALARVNIQSDGEKMRQLAEKVWEMALAGDQQAIKEIGERHDGKSVQTNDVNVKGSLTAVLGGLGRNNGSAEDDPPVA